VPELEDHPVPGSEAELAEPGQHPLGVGQQLRVRLRFHAEIAPHVAERPIGRALGGVAQRVEQRARRAGGDAQRRAVAHRGDHGRGWLRPPGCGRWRGGHGGLRPSAEPRVGRDLAQMQALGTRSPLDRDDHGQLGGQRGPHLRLPRARRDGVHHGNARERVRVETPLAVQGDGRHRHPRDGVASRSDLPGHLRDDLVHAGGPSGHQVADELLPAVRGRTTEHGGVLHLGMTRERRCEGLLVHAGHVSRVSQPCCSGDPCPTSRPLTHASRLVPIRDPVRRMSGA
jgi:hypothetical protein